MKNVMRWITANPITVASIVVVVLALGYALIFLNDGVKNFNAEVAKSKSQLEKINSLLKTQISVPALAPGQTSESYSTLPTEPVLKVLRTIYDGRNKQLSGVEKMMFDRNRGNHEVLVGNLFPDDPPRDTMRLDFRDRYKRALKEMLYPYEKDPTGPRLNAGMPPSQDQVDYELGKISADYSQRDTFSLTGENLSRGEALSQLQKMQKDRVKQMLIEAAQDINLYAVTERSSDEQMGVEFPSGFPFQVGPWSLSQEKPQMADLWEGQMSLWIQQDIARAIAHANQVWDPDSNVLNAPVKRLLGVEVIVDYLGLTEKAGTKSVSLFGGGGKGNMGMSEQEMYQMDMAKWQAPAPDIDGIQSRGRGKDQPKEPAIDVTRQMPVEYDISPSGRRSNPLYDVRLARVGLIADARKLADLFNALHQHNLMTVLHLRVTDVDEYEHLRQGFVYGSTDVVRLDMVIETLWLRKWTEPLMPKEVREMLGIEIEGQENQEE